MLFVDLPEAIARRRVLTSAEASAFCGLSLVHWRRMVAAGDAPKPIKIGARKCGWQVGTLIDWLDERAKQPAA